MMNQQPIRYPGAAVDYTALVEDDGALLLYYPTDAGDGTISYASEFGTCDMRSQSVTKPALITDGPVQDQYAANFATDVDPRFFIPCAEVDNMPGTYPRTAQDGQGTFELWFRSNQPGPPTGGAYWIRTLFNGGMGLTGYSGVYCAVDLIDGGTDVLRFVVNVNDHTNKVCDVAFVIPDSSVFWDNEWHYLTISWYMDGAGNVQIIGDIDLTDMSWQAGSYADPRVATNVTPVYYTVVGAYLDEQTQNPTNYYDWYGDLAAFSYYPGTALSAGEKLSHYNAKVVA